MLLTIAISEKKLLTIFSQYLESNDKFSKLILK